MTIQCSFIGKWLAWPHQMKSQLDWRFHGMDPHSTVSGFSNRKCNRNHSWKLQGCPLVNEKGFFEPCESRWLGNLNSVWIKNRKKLWATEFVSGGYIHCNAVLFEWIQQCCIWVEMYRRIQTVAPYCSSSSPWISEPNCSQDIWKTNCFSPNKSVTCLPCTKNTKTHGLNKDSSRGNINIRWRNGVGIEAVSHMAKIP